MKLSTEEIKKKIQDMGFENYIFIGVHDAEIVDCIVDWAGLDRIKDMIAGMMVKNNFEYFEPIRTVILCLVDTVEKAATLRMIKGLAKETNSQFTIATFPIHIILMVLRIAACIVYNVAEAIVRIRTKLFSYFKQLTD